MPQIELELARAGILEAWPAALIYSFRAETGAGKAIPAPMR